MRSEIQLLCMTCDCHEVKTDMVTQLNAECGKPLHPTSACISNAMLLYRPSGLFQALWVSVVGASVRWYMAAPIMRNLCLILMTVSCGILNTLLMLRSSPLQVPSRRPARYALHLFLQLLRGIPRHLSQVAGTQCIDRHWRSLKEFIGPAFPRKMKGQFGSKLHTEVNVLVKQWLYRMWTPGAARCL